MVPGSSHKFSRARENGLGTAIQGVSWQSVITNEKS